MWVFEEHVNVSYVAMCCFKMHKIPFLKNALNILNKIIRLNNFYYFLKPNLNCLFIYKTLKNNKFYENCKKSRNKTFN